MKYLIIKGKNMLSNVTLENNYTDDLYNKSEETIDLIKNINKDLFSEMISAERLRQSRAWPNESKQRQVSLEQWANILTEELGEFVKEVNDHNRLKAVIELAETAAVALRIAEVFFSKQELEIALGLMSHRAEHQKAKE